MHRLPTVDDYWSLSVIGVDRIARAISGARRCRPPGQPAFNRPLAGAEGDERPLGNGIISLAFADEAEDLVNHLLSEVTCGFGASVQLRPLALGLSPARQQAHQFGGDGHSGLAAVLGAARDKGTLRASQRGHGDNRRPTRRQSG